MSLLDTASLLLTPNAYKEGKLYSVIPTNGNGDLTFTRATTATRVNSAGLVELVPYNLVRYTENFSNAVWTKGPNVTITENTVIAPNGTLTADSINVTSTSAKYIFQDITYSGSHTFSIYAKYQSLQFIQLLISTDTTKFVNFDILNGLVTRQDNSVGTIENVGNGWFRCSMSLNATSQTQVLLGVISSGNSTRVESNSLVGTSYIWGAQLVEGTSALPYQKTETRLNIPRLDYSLGGCPNILLEPQRTNLTLRSEEFDNAYWSKNDGAIAANNTTAPNGTTTADKFTASANNSYHYVNLFTALTVSGSNTFSFYVKKSTATWIFFTFRDSAINYFNLDTGAFGTTPDTCTSQNVGNGWYRITVNRTDTVANCGIGVASGNGGAQFLANGTEAIFIWGAQLEAGAYATSYIPTTSASVTRNYDIPSLSNVYTNGFISASGGTWYSHLLNNVPRTRDSGGGVGLRLTNVAGNNLFHISTPSGSNQRYWIRKIIGGTNTDLYNTITNEIKVAIKWNGTTADIFVNGVEVVSATAFTSVDLENLNVNNPNIPYSINAMTLWSTPLTDAECIALTTI